MRSTACHRLSRRPLTGSWFRAISLRHWETRLASDHTAASTSRFSAATRTNPLFRIVYLAENHQVAIHEVGALLGNPAAPVANPRGSWAILQLDVILTEVVDLTDEAEQKILATNDMELTGVWRNSRQSTPTQQLGQALHQLPGVEGFLFHSTLANARCLAIFPDKLAGVSRIEFLNEQTGRVELLT